MSEYKLIYFDARARGETMRLLFALKGHSYTDVRVQQSEWPALKPSKPMYIQIFHTRRAFKYYTNKFIFQFISVMVWSHTSRFV